MRAIFISYRRDDAEGQAGRLFDDLSHHFGADAVFMDVAAIEPGRDFRQAIDQQVAECGVLLAIIGKGWVTARDDAGRRRLDDPMDFVRIETASALKRDIPVVPVLVHGAAMPRAEDLPDDLKALAFRNAVELTHARWESDVQLLAKALRPYVQTRPAAVAPVASVPAAGAGQTRSVSPRIAVAGLVGVLLLGSGWYAWQGKNTQEPARPVQTGATKPVHVSLVGSWLGSPDCKLVITRDDGKTIEGNCDAPGASHKLTGTYGDRINIEITIQRIDSNRCELLVHGYIKIKSDDVLEIGQGKWNGCGVNSESVSTVLTRA